MNHILFTILLVVLTFNFALSQSIELFQELNENGISLTTDQSAILSEYKGSKIYDKIMIVHLGNLHSIQNKGILPFKIPGDPRSYIAFSKTVNSYPDGSYLWIGGLKNDPSGEIVLSYAEGFIRGHIIIFDERYDIYGLGDQKAIITNVLREGFTCGAGEVEPDSTIEEPTTINSHSRSTCTEVRTLIVFWSGFTGSVSGQANYYISGANQSMNNSGLNVWLNLVGTFKTPFNDQGSMYNDLNYMNGPQLTYFSNLANQYKADIIAWIVNETGDNIKGLASPGPQSGYNYMIINHSGGNEVTFAHETGHNFGCNHQKCNPYGGASSCYVNVSPAYASAHVFECSGTKRTVMWGNAIDPTIKYYSNPNKNFSGVPTGVANIADHARVINDNKCAIANTQPPPMTTQISGPTSGNAYTLYTWNASVNNCPGKTYYWERSYDGLTYWTYESSSSSVSRQLYNNHLYWRLTVTCSDGQTGTYFYYCHNNDIGGYYRINDNIGFTSYPNPVSNEINIRIQAENTSIAELYLTDVLGNNHINQKLHLITGLNEHKLQVDNLSPGFYILSMDKDQIITSQKILISR